MAVGGPLLGLAFSFGARLLIEWLFPAPGQTVEGPRQSDLSISSSTYGTGIAVIYNSARVTCSLIWAAPIREQENRTTTGGKGGGPQITQISYEYFGYFAYLIGQGVIQSIEKIWLNGELVYNVSPDADSESISDSNEWFNEYCTFYSGTFTQPQDPTIVSFLGIENTPAYRGRSYLVFTNLPLEKYGNRPPSVSVLVKTAPFTLAQIITDICQRAGAPAALDFTNLPNENVTGFVQISPTTARSLIEQLQQAFFFSAVESNGILRFQRFFVSLTAVIPFLHLATRETEEERQVSFVETRQQETELPYEVRVNYYDPEEDYSQKVQYARRPTQSISINRNVVDYNLNIVLTASQAATIAARLLFTSVTARNQFKFTLPPEWIWLDPGDVVEIEGEAVVQITKINIGSNRLLEVEAVSFDDTNSTIPVSRPPASNRPKQVRLPRHRPIYLLDIPLLEEKDNEIGLYAVADSLGQLFQWRDSTASVLKESYLISQTEVVGKAISVLAPPLTCTVPDLGNTCDVEIEKFSLESVNEADWLEKVNLAILGNEIISFRFATLIAPKIYRLSHLIRGCYGTENETNNHVVDERFVLLRRRTRIPFTAAELNRNFWWQFNSGGFGDPQILLRANTGQSLRCYAPAQLRGQRDSAGNLTIRWERRTRFNGEWVDYQDVPLGEAAERYSVEILPPANPSGPPIRSATVSTNSFSYSAADQIADGYTLGDPVIVKVAQVNLILGPGKAATGAV